MVSLKRTLILILLFLAACSGGLPNFPEVGASATPVPPTSTPTPLAPTETPIPMAITVNGEGITMDEFNAELGRYKNALAATGKTVTEEEAVKAVREDFISQILLSQGAAEAGFKLDDAALKQKLDTLATSTGGADKLKSWETAHGYTEASFSSALVRASASAWMRDKIISAVPSTAEQVHVRQILLYNEDVAKSYYNQLQAGANFDDLAAQVDPVTRGDIGWFPRHYLADKAVEDAAFSLEEGAYSAIIPSEVGFHILKLLERQQARELSPDARTVLQEHALADWLESRRQQSSIVPAP